ncbi:PH domain-containing protein [Fervidibacillus albus]|uniref:PH domain-containing protein n=1 Tax=Fervidibacillus albus TaxID=2980026 RepID=A0A9E8LTC1_9BACI|nr:PH domain-containing protein [Fervidibacillus albus]WAA09250.1 PH domain-containing protein [Fervidibacillus albus]
MCEKKRLHPVAIVANLLKEIKEAIFPIIITFIISAGEQEGALDLFVFFVPFIIIAFTIISGFVRWLRFTYRIEEGELRIEHGLFVRKKRYIPFERIQSISTSEGILQRLFGLVKMTIETAGGAGETEAMLSAISKEESARIQSMFEMAKAKVLQENSMESVDEEQSFAEGTRPIIEEKKELVYMMSFKEILFVSLTSGGALGIIAAAVAFLSQFDELIPFDKLYSEFLNFVAHGIVLASIVGMFIIFVAYLVAIIRSMLKYSNFTVERTDENVIISYGLLEIRRTTVPLNRVQGVEIREHFIRSLFGYASVYVVNAGSGSTEESHDNILLFPFIKKETIAEIMKKILPEYAIDVPIHPVPERAKFRYIVRPFYYITIPIAIGIYFLRPWGWLLLLLFPIFSIIGYISYRFAGWNITENQLVLRHRFINGKTMYMFKNRIQALEIQSNWFQRRKKLGTIQSSIKSSIGSAEGKTVDVDEEVLMDIYKWYSRSQPNEGEWI